MLFRSAQNANAVTLETGELVAFSVLYGPNYNVCEMHLVKPEVTYVPELAGHEFYHCFYGEYHPRQNEIIEKVPHQNEIMTN